LIEEADAGGMEEERVAAGLGGDGDGVDAESFGRGFDEVMRL